MDYIKNFFKQSKNNLQDNKKQAQDAIKTLKKDKQKFDIPNEKIEQFLNSVVERLRNKEPILLFGDYDVDGIFSTAIVYESLREMIKTIHKNKADADEAYKNISIKIPTRKDGYGINKEFVQAVFDTTNTKLIITCDNGSQTSMMDIIESDKYRDNYFVFDHHANGDFSDKKYSNVLNPNSNGLLEISTGLLTHRFFEAVQKKHPEYKFSDKSDLAAFTIISDVASRNNNREIVMRGLDIINNAEAKHDMLVTKINENAQKIQEKASKNEASPRLVSSFKKSYAELEKMDKENLAQYRRPFFSLLFHRKAGTIITAKDLSFTAIPMLNSVNRMGGDPLDIFKAIICTQKQADMDNNVAANRIIDTYYTLDALNLRRRNMSRQATEEALSSIKQLGLEKNAFIFIYAKELNIGLAGLVAQRVFDRTGADVVVASNVQLNNGSETISFSGRGNNVYRNLEKIAGLDLESDKIFSFGGHLKALGGEIKDLERFEKLVDEANKKGVLTRVADNLKEHNILLDKPMSLFDFIEFSKYLTKITDGLAYSKTFLAPVALHFDMLKNLDSALKTSKEKDFVPLKFEMFNPLNDTAQDISYMTNSDLAVEFIDKLKEDEKNNKLSIVYMEASLNCRDDAPKEIFSGLIKHKESLTAESFLTPKPNKSLNPNQELENSIKASL